MRITWLLEAADQLWGGIKVALEDANWLQRRGHQVTVVSRSGPPNWLSLECGFRRVQDFRPEHLPDGDVVIGTFWTTVPWAASAGPGKGVPVHFCQGYEGDMPENAPLRDRIEAVYRLPRMNHVTIAPHLTELLQTRFGCRPCEVVYAIDHAVHHAAPNRPRTPGTPLRVGLVGPYQVSWKDLATGFAACRLAHQAGQKLVLVRATNTAPDPAERQADFPVEWHEKVPPAQMGDYYRSLDVFLGTSNGADEGFFLPAIEAMACGVPTVLTDIPCFRQHERGDGEPFTLFVPPRDPAALAEALVLAGNLTDVRAKLRQAGLAVAARYHRDRHGEQLEAALRGFADTAGSAPLRLVAGQSENAEHVLEDLGSQLCAAADRMRPTQPAAMARLLAAAAQLAPDDLDLRQSVGEAQLAAGEPTAALATFDALITRGRDEQNVHDGRGHALHALGRLHEAAQAFRAAIACGARGADAYNRLGVVLYQAGDVVGARQSFERALMLQPAHVDAHANLAALPAA